LRAKVDVQDISQDLATWQHFGGNLAENPEEPSKVESGPIGWGGRTEESAQSSAEANSGGWRWFKDPRLGTLGMRGLFTSNTLPPLVEAGEEVDDEYYLLWRLEQGIPEGSIEIPKGEAIPLEYNLAGLSAISFEKGCYVGQELVARTHHRGVIRKRLMPVNFLQDNGEGLEY
jgi:folate-binding protein YgfZ